MAKVGEIQAESIYRLMKKTINDCIEKNEWEFYKNKTLGVAKWIKDLKNYLENRMYPTPRDEKWASDLEYFEAAYYKMVYFKDLWSASDWILFVLENEAKGTSQIFNISKVNAFISGLLSFQLIKTYRGQISRIINANITGKQLLMMYNHVRMLTDNFREPLDDSMFITESFSKINEGFYNPFDIDEAPIIDDRKKNDVEERIIRKIKVYNSKNQ